MTDPTPTPMVDLENLHPADLADRLQRLPENEAIEVMRRLPAPQAAAALAEIEPDRLPGLVEALPEDRLGELVRCLAPNDAADLVQELPALSRRQVLARLPTELVASVRSLMRYAEDTAGGIMTDRFIALREDMTVEQVRELLRGRAQAERTEDVAYLYVTDPTGRLVGIVSLRDLVFRRSERIMRDIMNREVMAVRESDDQEALARQFEHYHYLGLPVVDAEGALVGVVKASDAIEIARKEATEDMQLMVGLSGEERVLTPWRQSIRRRLPWLYINLATAFIAAFVVGLFEETIAGWTALAVFLPVIAGQGGNAGMQTLTVIIRDMALGELTPGDGRKALWKEVSLALANGIAIGLVVGVVGWLWQGSPMLGLVAGAAMLLNQLAAGLSGVLIPFGLKSCRVDPALASSIFLTTVTDVAGFFFFLGLASLAVRWAGVG